SLAWLGSLVRRLVRPYRRPLTFSGAPDDLGKDFFAALTGGSSGTHRGYKGRPTAPRESEPVARVAESALCEREDLDRPDREHEDLLWEDIEFIVVVKAAVADQVLPSSVPLRRPHLGQTRERVIVGDLDSVALDHDVQPCVPLVAAGGQDHVRAGAQVDGLLLGEAGAKVDGPVHPHGNERCDVGPPVGPDRRDPEKFGRLERQASLIPPGGSRGRITESLVKGGHWDSHRSTSSDRPPTAVPTDMQCRLTCGRPAP